jgi:hypothetical protein
VAKCEYEYRAEDTAVLLGEKTVREICGSPFAPKEPYTYRGKKIHLCPAHAHELKLLAPDILERKNRSNAFSNKRLRAALEEAESRKKNRSIAAHIRKEVIALSHNILQDKDFDLGEMFAEMTRGGMDVTSEIHLRSLFSIWWCADPETRKPGTLREVSAVLGGIGLKKVMDWYQDEAFAQIVDEERLRRIRLVQPFVDKVIMQLALSGDLKAAEFLRGVEVKVKTAKKEIESEEIDDVDEIIEALNDLT